MRLKADALVERHVARSVDTGPLGLRPRHVDAESQAGNPSADQVRRARPVQTQREIGLASREVVLSRIADQRELELRHRLEQWTQRRQDHVRRQQICGRHADGAPELEVLSPREPRDLVDARADRLHRLEQRLAEPRQDVAARVSQEESRPERALQSGAWAERVAVPVRSLFLLPDDVCDEDGSQLPLNPITAWGLLDVANLQPGQWVGLTAPASSVSQIVAALAAMRRVRVLPIENTKPLDEAARVRSLTEGQGLAALLDSVGGPLVQALFGVLAPGATLVAYGTMSDEAIVVRNATLIYSNLTWRGFGIDRWLSGLDAPSRTQMLQALCEAMRAKRLPLPVPARFPLADIREALRLSEVPATGKILLE